MAAVPTRMSQTSAIVRHYHHEDFERVIRLALDHERRGEKGCVVSSSDLVETLTQPPPGPEENVFVAEQAGGVVGFAAVSQERGIGRAIVRFVVGSPRVRGIAEKLIDAALPAAQAAGLRVIHVNTWQGSATEGRLLTSRGFALVRRYLELSLDLSAARLGAITGEGFRFRPLQPGEEGRITTLQNRSFHGSWGFNPNTASQIASRMLISNTSPQDVILAFDGEKPVAYCWTRVGTADGGGDRLGTARIYMLGVDPEYRGRGLGRSILLAGLAHLKQKGARFVELTVDSENRAARALYRKTGFETRTSSLWYEKRLGGPS